MPDDATSFRCDRLVGDVEALREHLGLETIDVLAHSAGANLVAMYSSTHPDRISRLVLVTPSTRAVGIDIGSDVRLATARLRADEPWFPAAYTALEATTAGTGSADDWAGITPFVYGRWDEQARMHHAAESEQRNDEAASVFGMDGVFTPEHTRAALRSLDAPVLLLAGAFDVAAPPSVVADYGRCFPQATVIVQPAAGHFPWMDDPGGFAATVARFLA